MAKKPRACRLPLPADGGDNWEQLVDSQEKEKHHKARLPPYWLVIYNANDRLASMQRGGLVVQRTKLSSYHTSLNSF